MVPENPVATSDPATGNRSADRKLGQRVITGFCNRYGRILPVRITVLRQYGSPRSSQGEKGAYESPVSEDGNIGQDANCARDLAAYAERKNADPDADGPDGSQQPHDRETRIQKDREIVRVRKDSASRANESSDSGCYGDAGCCRSPLPPGEPSAEQHLNDEGRNQDEDDAPSEHGNWKFMRRCSSCVEK